MPKKEVVNCDGLPHIYNVTHTVGNSKDRNERYDVMLVQYLLKEVYENGFKFSPPLLQPDSKPMKVDGICGPITRKWIRHFQEQGVVRGKPLRVDGRVHSAKGVIGSVFGEVYTIVRLNSAFKHARPDGYNAITFDEKAPMVLRGVFWLEANPEYAAAG